MELKIGIFYQHPYHDQCIMEFMGIDEEDPYFPFKFIIHNDPYYDETPSHTDQYTEDFIKKLTPMPIYSTPMAKVLYGK